MNLEEFVKEAQEALTKEEPAKADFILKWLPEIHTEITNLRNRATIQDTHINSLEADLDFMSGE